MPYSTDDHLVKVQKDILSLGVNDWNDQHAEAEGIINRTIESEWFGNVAIERGYTSTFDPDTLLLPEQLLRSSVYKVLELAYLFMMQDSTESQPFKEKYELFKNLYNIEIDTTFKTGLTYDWDGSGSEDQNESNITSTPRMLTR